jgi:hypothetical protein
MKRVEGYMTRAEQLRGMLEKENAPKAVAAAVDMDKWGPSLCLSVRDDSSLLMG